MATVSVVSVEDWQAARLRRSRLVASGLLVLAAVTFVGTLIVPDPGEAVLLLRAVAEAALVGGLADWFAVTALFRRPLGLPIPHTAIVPANKDRIGEGLARFLDRHVLAPEMLLAELRSLNIADRIASWLARPRNAQALAREIVRAMPPLLHAIDDRQIVAFLNRGFGAALRDIELAPLAGQMLRAVTAAGYHEAVLDSTLDYARDFIERNREWILDAVGERRRRWVPRSIDRQIARAMLRGITELIDDLRRPGGAARLALMQKIDEIATELTTASAPTARFSISPQAILGRRELRAWIGSSWDGLRDALLRDMERPSPRLRRTLALVIAAVGEGLQADPAMRQRLDATLEALVVEALPWRPELVRFVGEVVRRWEPRAFSDRIELAVGADLQFIRMNGTVVGGLVGGALYLISTLARS
ncbi:MAG: DUF445 domain-containing protein [Alphaproteobacteria bacterium]